MIRIKFNILNIYTADFKTLLRKIYLKAAENFSPVNIPHR